MSTPEPSLPPAAEPHDEDLEAGLQQLASKLFPQDEVQKNMRFMEEMEAKITELETRLSLAEEAKALALKEREAADEGRKKLEKTLAELLSKFASARENHSVVLREMEQMRTEFASRQQSAQADHTAVESLRADKEALQTENEDLKQKVESQYLNLEVLQTQLRSEHQTTEELRSEIAQLKKRAHGAVPPALQEHERVSKEMGTHVDDILEQLHGLRDEINQRCNQMQNVANYLGGQLQTTHTQLVMRLQPEKALSSSLAPGGQEADAGDEMPPASSVDSGMRANVMESGVRAV